MRHHLSVVRRSAMKRLSSFAVTAVFLLTVGFTAFAFGAFGEAKAQQTSDVERVNTASQVFIAAIDR
jgi:hypothetical protein